MSLEPDLREEDDPDVIRQPEEPAGTGSPAPSEVQIATVRTRSRPQILVPRPHSRLTYVVVCGVGLFTVSVVVVAITIYKTQTGEAISALFGQNMALLPPANKSASADANILAPVVNRHLAKHKRKFLLAQSSCKTDVCVWTENYLRGKLNWSVNPCADFYAHVCSRRWTDPDLNVQSRAYQERTAGMMMMNIEKFFQNYRKENEERYREYPGVFLHQAISFLPKCKAEEKSKKNLASLRTLLEEYSLGNWPYKEAPRDASVVNISAFVDRDFGVFPFARVFLRKLFEGDRAYTVHIDAPSFTLKRYNLAYLGKSSENFSQMAALALSLFEKTKDVTKQAEAIALLEKQLHEIASAPRFLEFQDKIKSVGWLNSTDKWKWKEYLAMLFQDHKSFDKHKTIAIINLDYVSVLASVLNEYDTATLLNYIGYRLVVHMSPLLGKPASPLLRLSHDHYLEFVPDRLQACMHLLERLYKHGMRFFGRMTFSRSNSTLLLKHYDYGMKSLEAQIKSSMSNHLLSSLSWLERSAIGVGVDKIESMRLIFLDSTDDINTIAAYYNINDQNIDQSHLVESFRELQAGTMNVYWDTKPGKDDLDARFDHTALVPGHEYLIGRNTLFLPHANIAFLNDITQSIDPILVPLILAEVFRGMFTAVDRRGAFVDHALSMASWWNPGEVSKFWKVDLCLQDQYYAEIHYLLGDDVEVRMKLEENIADNAAVGPLHDTYLSVLTSQDGAERLKISVDGHRLDMQQLFFVLYAVGLCDNPSHESWVRKLMFGEVPGRLRTNIPLMNFAKFSAAFGCPEGAPMNPTRKCIVW
ncbi:hypothetical protein V5799_026964 [Amblyomma americanum]|uniref:M13 family peptidase n=1 Tax=Amblyomma americanum TaxID=6943 RepID=A0AAQ4DH31_AMBAM